MYKNLDDILSYFITQFSDQQTPDSNSLKDDFKKAISEFVNEKIQINHTANFSKEAPKDLTINHNSPTNGEELARKAKFLDTIIENIPTMVFIKDAKDLRFVRLNKLAEKILGFKNEEMIGKNDYDFFPKDQADFFTQKDRDVLKSGKILDIPQEVIETGNNEKLYLHTIKVPILDENGDPQYLMGISENITQRVEAEQQKENLQKQLLQSQKLEAIGMLAGGIAHEFNNLLGGILGHASLLKKQFGDNEKIAKRLDIIMNCAERSAKLTSELLGFSRQGSYEIKNIDVNSLIEEAVAILGSSIHKNIKIYKMLDPNLRFIEADSTQLLQCFLNLGLNARDAMPDGGKLFITTENITLDSDINLKNKSLKEGKYVKISFEDTGVGIAKDIQDKIFNPFFTTKEIGQGTGLGLSMIYGVIEKLGGAVSVYSEEGSGAVFNLYLPAYLTTNEIKLNKEHANSNLSENSIKDLSILVVDDEAWIRELAKDSLESEGAHVICAEDGLEAIKFITNQNLNFDLIILDVMMPNLGGIETYKEIKNKLSEKTKIIFCSGYAENKAISDLKNSKNIKFLQKPYTVHNLLEVISNQIS